MNTHKRIQIILQEEGIKNLEFLKKDGMNQTTAIHFALRLLADVRSGKVTFKKRKEEYVDEAKEFLDERMPAILKEVGLTGMSDIGEVEEDIPDDFIDQEILKKRKIEELRGVMNKASEKHEGKQESEEPVDDIRYEQEDFGNDFKEGIIKR